MRIPFIDNTEPEHVTTPMNSWGVITETGGEFNGEPAQHPKAKATQYIKQTLATFSPREVVPLYTWVKLYEAISVLIEQTTQPVITIQQAYDMGAKGGEPTLEEKVLFEAWMQGHCWLVEGDWDGETYVHKSEKTGYLHPGAMLSRQLWAAWRDRAALSKQKEQS